MNRVVCGPHELNIGSSILTRRGGTDANAPESPRKAILRDWHLGILTPQILENLGQPNTNIVRTNNVCGTRIGRNEQTCPALEAFKLSGDF